jgi:hypothetical protein
METVTPSAIAPLWAQSSAGLAIRVASSSLPWISANMSLIAGSMLVRSIGALLMLGTLPLRTPYKSSTSRAIFWLLSGHFDQKVIRTSTWKCQDTNRGGLFRLVLSARFGNRLTGQEFPEHFAGSAPHARDRDDIFTCRLVAILQRLSSGWVFLIGCSRKFSSEDMTRRFE